jgi:hypothetical protein
MGLNTKTALSILACIGCLLALSACEKPAPPNDLPVSHWFKDENACIRKTAQSITASGRPWPNEVREMRGGGPNTVGQDHLVRYDLWVADQLYVLPGKGQFLRRNGFDATHNPWKYSSVSGSVEDVLGIPQQKFKDPRVGGTLYGNLICQIDTTPSAWIENRAEHAPTREALIRKLVQKAKENPDALNVEVKERNDIKMDEINVMTSRKTYAFAYVPYDMKQALYDGTIAYKSIGCSSAYDPDAALDISGKCQAWITLAPGIYLQFEGYQQYLPLLPALHDHMLQTLIASRRKWTGG